jgi:hypothetical protein
MEPQHRVSDAFPLVVLGADVRRDLYLLLACTLGSKRYAEITNGVDYSPLQNLKDEFEQAEIGRLLLSLAVRIRVLDDRGQVPRATMQRSCGVLEEGADKMPLSLREACNKVVHASSAQFYIAFLDHFDAALPSPTSDHLELRMLLFGSKGRVTWQATLNLVELANAALAAQAIRDA